MKEQFTNIPATVAARTMYILSIAPAATEAMPIHKDVATSTTFTLFIATAATSSFDE